ncbi:hypothetical protein [Hansschlegelia sp. KR7-227]|uniref:hypothetical protein n=1 Tax=Hansschlegelia sp. KR7-227 TaxID=3400914 RepID=UPI003BFF3EEC
MGRFASMLAAAIRAVSAALIGSWVLVRELGKSVLRWVPGRPEPLPPLPAAVAEEPAPAPADMGLAMRDWAAERLKGGIPRLPRGVDPRQAEWAARLLSDELAIVARSSPAAVGAHISGGTRLRGVRDLMSTSEREAAASAAQRDQEKQARRSEIRAALRRTSEAHQRRTAAWGQPEPATLAI